MQITFATMGQKSEFLTISSLLENFGCFSYNFINLLKHEKIIINKRETSQNQSKKLVKNSNFWSIVKDVLYQKFSIFKFSRFILILFVCLLTGAAYGRELRCEYTNCRYTLWPKHKCCLTDQNDFSSKFSTEPHSFSGYPSEKSETKTLWIHRSQKVDFIPLDIFSEFPNLNGLQIDDTNLPTLKAELFKAELENIKYLFLPWNAIRSIEPSAFQYLTKLKWINLRYNSLQSLPNQIFQNNPDLMYIGLEWNSINSIHPNFFDGLNRLKQIEFRFNDCSQADFGCKECLLTQADIKSHLQGCFDNCAKDGACKST